MVAYILSFALVLSANAFLVPKFARNVKLSNNIVARQETFLSAVKSDLFSGKFYKVQVETEKLHMNNSVFWSFNF
jgi:hypothetical protein